MEAKRKVTKSNSNKWVKFVGRKENKRLERLGRKKL